MKSWTAPALLIAAACAPSASLTESQEYYAGRAACADVLNKYEIVESEDLVSYITDIGYLMARASDRPETFKGYRFAVLETEEVNAYTAPSGFIFLTRGIIKRCQNEDELAGVIAHELGHSVKRHPELEAKAAMNASKWAEGASFLVSVAKALDQSKDENYLKALNLFEDVVKGLSKAYADGYGSDQELEADAEGAKILARVGYDPRGLKTMLSRVKDTSDKGWNSNKYPSTSQRLVAIEKSIQDNRLTGTADPARTARFQRIVKGGK